MEALDFKLKHSRVLIMIGILLFFLLLFFIFLCFKVNREIIYPNIIIQDINVGNLNKEQAKNLLIENFENTLHNKRIEFIYQEEKWVYEYKDFNSRYEYDKAIQDAFNFGKDGNLLQRMKAFVGLTFNSQEQPLTVQIEDTLLHTILVDIGKKVQRPSADALIEYVNGNFIITREIYGENLQIDKAFQIAKEAIKLGSECYIELPVERTPPKIKGEDLQRINSSVAAYSTNYNPTAKERVENLRIASWLINGKVLLPGDVFSTLELIGPITEENGYKDAPVIVGGNLEQGIGGGVCQIATTLFNAAVRADLEIIERRHHSFPVSYVPLGQDATIAGDWVDFKFKNNKNNPIYVQMFLSGDKVVTNIFGNDRDGNKKIELETEMLSKIHPSVNYKKDPNKYTDYKKVEREARTGYKVNVYKVSYEDGKEIYRELLHYDYYKPVDGIIVVGTKEKKY